MVKKKTYFTVGLFVIAGLVIGIAAIIWVGASQYFQKGSRYVTYFNESVQGLQVDSNVKYLGVDVGRVEKIRVAPDNKLIEIIMKINFGGSLEYTTVASLKMAGITGIVYVELDRKKIRDTGLAPKIDFVPPYPVIPSRPSDIRQITTTVEEIVQQVRSIDFNGIAEQVKATAKAVENFVDNEEMKKIVSNLQSTTLHLDRMALKVNTILTKGGAEEILKETRETIEDARQVIGRVKEEVDSLKLSETRAKANNLMESVEAQVKKMSTDIQATGENLRQASETLEDLVERLSADPSDLIFSEPPPRKQGKGTK
jgi:phospholipid/cholesterol/gamma-HCH transport system substrate-binding protein